MNNQEFLINDVDIYIKNFAKVFSKPQFVHFKQIVKGTVFTERKSINSYAKSFSIHQTLMSRFVNINAKTA